MLSAALREAMSWEDFLESYPELADSTVRRRIASLKEIGEGWEIVDTVLNLPAGELQDALIKKAMRLGAVFTEEDFQNLEGELSEPVWRELAAYGGFDPDDPYGELAGEAEWEEDEWEDRQPEAAAASSNMGCLFGGLLGLLALSGSSHTDTDWHRTGGQCSDSDEDEPHYGYRYGRWYYGTGHSWGCENEHKKKK